MIDRRTLVSRHDVHLHADSPDLVLTLGNGDFAFSADATGLQTLISTHDASGLDPHTPDFLATRVVEGATQSTWGWHEQPNPAGHTVADAMTAYSTARGPVYYPDRPSLERVMAIASGQVAPEPGIWPACGSAPTRTAWTWDGWDWPCPRHRAAPLPHSARRHPQRDRAAPWSSRPPRH